MNIQSAITQGAQILKNKCFLNPYLDSEILMSKFVTIKKITTPSKHPKILFFVLVKKNLDINPIKITLPHVNKVNPWRPINKSVIAKLRMSAGIYLRPSIAGT